MADKTVPLHTLYTARLRIEPLDRAAFDEKLAELAEQSRLRQNPASEAINTEYRARWQVQW